MKVKVNHPQNNRDLKVLHFWSKCGDSSLNGSLTRVVVVSKLFVWTAEDYERNYNKKGMTVIKHYAQMIKW